MNKSRLLSFVFTLPIIFICTVANAALAPDSHLNFDPGAPDPGGDQSIPPISGSYFGMEVSPGVTIYTTINQYDPIKLGSIQPASGSHSGPPDGTESPGIDNPWLFFGNTGMHQTTAPITIIFDGGGIVALDFSGWSATWNGIPDITLPGVATMFCTSTCESGDTYVLDYMTFVPDGDPSGFGGVPYILHLEGQVGSPSMAPVSDPNGPYNGTVGIPVDFDGTGSSDPDGFIVAYDWDFGDGNTGMGATPSHAYVADGVYTVSLIVTDDTGNISDPAVTTATIAIGNMPPVSDPNGPYNGTVGIPVDFDGTGSSDPDGFIVAYDWDFGDGNTGMGATPSHTYAAAGMYNVTLSITDDAGAIDSQGTMATIADVPACDGITIDNASWRSQGNGQLRVMGSGIKNGEFVLSNAFALDQVIGTSNGNSGKFNFHVNGRNLNPVPCRIRVEQPDEGLCGEADVANAPADCAPL